MKSRLIELKIILFVLLILSVIFLKLSYAETDSKAMDLFTDCIRQLKSEEYKKAAGSCEEAVRIKPDYGEAFFALGYAYDKLGRYEDEIKVLREGLTIKKD